MALLLEKRCEAGAMNSAIIYWLRSAGKGASSVFRSREKATLVKMKK
jgi:hypothetical protein